MKGPRFLKGVGAIALLVACGSGDAPGALRGHTISLLDTAWVLASSADDTVLQHPLAITASSGRVYVVDIGARRLLALDAASGALDWVGGRRGEGPGEFMSPAYVTVMRGGQVVVGDREGGRLTVFSHDGELVGTHASLAPDIHGICAVSTSEILIAVYGGPAAFLLAEIGTGSDRWLNTPRPGLDTLPSLARQANLTSAAGSGCWITLMAASEFLYFHGESFDSLRTYVETVPFPEVVTRDRVDALGRLQSRSQRLARPPAAAQAAAYAEDTLYVLFGGAGPDAYQVVDLYGPSGAYVRSYRLPGRATGIAVDNRRLYLLGTTLRSPDDTAAGYPSITALEMR